MSNLVVTNGQFVPLSGPTSGSLPALIATQQSQLIIIAPAAAAIRKLTALLEVASLSATMVGDAGLRASLDVVASQLTALVTPTELRATLDVLSTLTAELAEFDPGLSAALDVDAGNLGEILSTIELTATLEVNGLTTTIDPGPTATLTVEQGLTALLEDC